MLRVLNCFEVKGGIVGVQLAFLYGGQVVVGGCSGQGVGEEVGAGSFPSSSASFQEQGSSAHMSPPHLPPPFFSSLIVPPPPPQAKQSVLSCVS